VLRDANIICLSSIDWDFNRQNPQEVALGFAASGNRVLFIENSGVRSAQWRDLPRLWSRLTNWWRARGGLRAEAVRGIDIYSPLLLTFPYSRTATAINRGILRRVIRRWLERTGAGGPLIVITFLPTPLALEIIHALQPSLAVYYCIDDLAESSPAARRVATSQAKLFAEADLVLVTSHELYEMAKTLSANVELLVSGVRCQEFARARALRSQRPHLLDTIGRPVIGFAGSLRSATDLDLTARVARLAPDLNFVLAGPHLADTRELAALPNVHLLGEMPHEDVIELMVRFDVGILPYVLNRFTAAVMPVKLKEYFAAGLPVVATPLPELVSFAAAHPGMMSFASDAEAFASALRTELARNTPDAEQRRMALAREFDWARQIERMMDAMEHARSRANADYDRPAVSR